MSSYVLSCCSAIDLTSQWLAEHDVNCIYFAYDLGQTWYRDDFGETMPPAELYRRMLAGEHASTSQITVGEYMNAFKPFLEEGKDVLHVTLSSGITKTYYSACMAAEQLRAEYPNRTIRIVDSLCASSGYGLLMDGMVEQRDAGMGIDELADWAEAHRREVNHLFFSTDLTFFVRGGRVTPFAGAVGNVLKICPLMHVAVDGSLEVKEKIRTKARTKRRTLERMGELVRDGHDYDGPVFMSHSECLEDVQELAATIEQEYPRIRDGKVQIFPIGATVGVHTGPGTVTLFFWGNPERW